MARNEKERADSLEKSRQGKVTTSQKAATAKKMLINSPVSAKAYVKSGLNNLNLKPREKQDLFNKLVPIVERQIKSERGRTLTRGEGMANRAASEKIKSAKKKILGGK
jgi:hypothetical protein